MNNLELFCRVITLKYLLDKMHAAILFSVFKTIAEKSHAAEREAYANGKAARSPHQLLIGDDYIILRFHDLWSQLKIKLEKVSLYCVDGCWYIEVNTRSNDPEAEFWHFLRRLNEVTRNYFKMTMFEKQYCPSVELVTAVAAEPYLKKFEAGEHTKNPKIKRMGTRILKAIICQATIPGHEDYPFAYEFVVTHQGYKRNRCPELARLEFLPISRTGCSPITYRHPRIPPQLGAGGWLLFARYINELLEQEASAIRFKRVPSYWKANSITF